MNDISAAFGHKRRQGGKLFFRLLLYLGIAVTAILIGEKAELFADDTNHPFRLAFSSSMFSEVNESDVRAAMKVWIMTVAKERGIPVDPDPNIHLTVEELAKFGLANKVEGFGIITPEYEHLRREMTFDRFAVGTVGGSITEKYLLLVRQDSSLERLDQLAGRSLNILKNPRMSLAVIWLDSVLVEADLKRTSDFFSHVTLNKKAAQVVLPVFFGKDDACLVTRESFEVMGELNPQLKKQLRVLAASPGFVPSGFAFRADYRSAYRTRILEAMARLEDSPAGRQILALTQADRIEDHPISCLDDSLELLARHRQLFGETRTTATNKATETIGGGR